MTTQDLDEFFAQCEDVLTDWDPGIDAATLEHDGPDLLAQPIDSYYVEPRGRLDQDGVWRPPGYWQARRAEIEAGPPPMVWLDEARHFEAQEDMVVHRLMSNQGLDGWAARAAIARARLGPAVMMLINSDETMARAICGVCGDDAETMETVRDEIEGFWLSSFVIAPSRPRTTVHPCGCVVG